MPLDTTVPSSLPPDPAIEIVFTPQMALDAGWELIETLQVDEWRSYRRKRAGERMHYCITYKHRVMTLTQLPPIGLPRY